MPIVFNVRIANCPIFAAATLDCHFTSRRPGRRVCTPSLLSRASLVQGMHEGWRRRFRVTQANQIKLWIKVNTIRLTVTKKIESSILSAYTGPTRTL